MQVQHSPGAVHFAIVGLGDKAVAESRERVRSALSAIGLALPAERIIVNLAPADLPKEGSHFDLPIALGLLVAMGALPQDSLSNYIVLGELALDGAIAPIAGALPAAIFANSKKLGIICPAECGNDAAWSGIGEAGGGGILAASDLLQLINHFKGEQKLSSPELVRNITPSLYPDMADVRGQAQARFALEVAATGGHSLLLSGPPGAGKSMLAQRLGGILPPMTAEEMLEVKMIASLAARPLTEESNLRPYRSPHHSASMAALVGGGRKAGPGEISLAHNGVLFLDELPEFSRQALEALRQPMESGTILVSRAIAHVSYPARFQLIAAMNPCRCGYAHNPKRACHRLPRCVQEYRGRISGPLLDRFDIQMDIPPLSVSEMGFIDPDKPPPENSESIAKRVLAGRKVQIERNAAFVKNNPPLNGYLEGEALQKLAPLDLESRKLLEVMSDEKELSARAVGRILRVSRTIADLRGAADINKKHLAVALGWRGAG